MPQDTSGGRGTLPWCGIVTAPATAHCGPRNTPVSRIDGIFFDLDGTLTDPWVGITRCIRHALEQAGVDAPPAEDLTWCIGPPLRESLEALLGDRAAAEVALQHFRARFAETGLYENRLYDGVPEALGLLRDEGVALFVATSKPEVYATRIVDHFGLARFFQGVFGATLHGERTGKADVLRWALGESGVSPGAAVMVGDRSHDMLGAAANGMLAAGALYGYGTREELEAAGARLLLDSPGEFGLILEASRQADGPRFSPSAPPSR